MPTEEQKTKKREATARYRERHPEKVRADALARYYANRDKELARGRVYKQNNREVVLAKGRILGLKRYYSKKDQILAADKIYREKNLDKIKARKKRYHLKNSDKIRAKCKAYYDEHRDEKLAYNKGYYVENKDRLMEYNFKRSILKKYGVTYEQYLALFESQGGVCLICRRPPEARKRLAVDHCHLTTTVRGLLCSMCNAALGFLEEDVERIEALLDYAKKCRSGSQSMGQNGLVQ